MKKNPIYYSQLFSKQGLSKYQKQTKKFKFKIEQCTNSKSVASTNFCAPNNSCFLKLKCWWQKMICGSFLKYIWKCLAIFIFQQHGNNTEKCANIYEFPVL